MLIDSHEENSLNIHNSRGAQKKRQPKVETEGKKGKNAAFVCEERGKNLFKPFSD